jgi:RNA polymerase sigma factor (sigma-70 family)
MIGTQPTRDTLVTRASAAFAAFQGGERKAFDLLVEMSTPLLWHTARSQGVSPVAAEDVLQTVWLNLLNSAESVRDPQTIVKFLMTSTRREAWRVLKREQVISAKAVSSPDDDEVAGIPAPEEALPDSVVLQDSRRRVLWAHISRLAPKCRELLRVIAFADRPDYAEIAESLGMPVGSIGPTRGRCLAKLRNQLGHDPQWEA